ncbi:MAG: PEP-CTERM sorting domain-containing protein [Phycisphaerales bacterium]
MLRTFLAAAASVAFVVPAWCTVTVDVGVTTGGGNVTNALNVTTTSGWIGTNILVSLTQGSVIGVNFDGSSSVGYGAVELGAPDVVDLGPAGINAEWSGDQAVGLQTIGQFVFSDDAQGTWSLAMFESASAQADFIGGTLADGTLLTDFVPGDLNVDGFTGIDDLNIVLGQWNSDGSGDPRSDPTGDGFVGINDLNKVLGDWNAGTAQGPWDYDPGSVTTPGDLNGDEFVGIPDLNIVLGNWHHSVTPGDLLQGDPSGDGFVGLDDLNIVSTYFHQGTPPVALVPEPAGLALFSLGALSLLKRRTTRA